MNTITQAKELGFTTGAEQAEAAVSRGKKLLRAYQDYAFIPAEKIVAFQMKLYDASVQHSGKAGLDLVEHYDTLVLEPVAQYKGIPPTDVLEKMSLAKATGIFDTFEVARIASVREYKDPILFGCIEGCSDRFYISQWDSDVSFEDLANA